MERTQNRPLRLVASKSAAGAVRTAATPQARLSESDYRQFETPLRNAASRTARRLRLTAVEAEDLLSDLWVRVLTDRRVVERFHRRASLETYFSVIARNLVLDARNKTFGKWRPTVAAQRHSAAAVEFERLVVRDKVPAETAIELLRARGESIAERDLRSIFLAAPKARRRYVDAARIHECPSADPSPFDHVVLHDTARHAVRLNHALAHALACLSADDRQLLALRYGLGRSVAEIAKSMSLPQKALYRRFERLLRGLKRHLQGAGVERSIFHDALASSASHLSALLMPAIDPDNSQEMRNTA